MLLRYGVTHGSREARRRGRGRRRPGGLARGGRFLALVLRGCNTRQITTSPAIGQAKPLHPLWTRRCKTHEWGVPPTRVGWWPSARRLAAGTSLPGGSASPADLGRKRGAWGRSAKASWVGLERGGRYPQQANRLGDQGGGSLTSGSRSPWRGQERGWSSSTPKEPMVDIYL